MSNKRKYRTRKQKRYKPQYTIKKTNSNNLTWDDFKEMNLMLMSTLQEARNKVYNLKEMKDKLLPDIDDQELDELWIGISKTIDELQAEIAKTALLHGTKEIKEEERDGKLYRREVIKVFTGPIDINDDKQTALSVDLFTIYNNLQLKLDNFLLTSVIAYSTRVMELLENKEGVNNGKHDDE